MKTWESGGIAPTVMTSALDGEWSASRFCRFTPTEFSIGVEDIERRKIFPLPRIEPRAVQLVAHRYATGPSRGIYFFFLEF
jgi:hypothetical protein